MSHATEQQHSLTADHDRTSTLPSKDSQPPISSKLTMAPPGGVLDHDTQVYYAKQYRQFWASGPSSAISVLAGAPFENVKTRMQSKYFPTTMAAWKYTYQTEGLRGFWVGAWAPMVNITFSRISGFLVYRKAKYTIDDYVIQPTWGDSAVKYSNDPLKYPNLWTNLCFIPAGMISGAAITIFLTPIELLKNAAQTSVLMANNGKTPGTSSKANGKVGLFSAAKQIIRQHGVSALWTGFRLHLIRDTIGSGCYFGIYESSKQAMGAYLGMPKVNETWVPALAGGLAGLVAWVFTYPLDTTKTRAQSNLLGRVNGKANTSDILDTAGKVMARSSKWKGVEMIIVRSFIQNMIQMLAFERVKIWIDRMEFRDGSKELPHIRRDRGKDTKIKLEGVKKAQAAVNTKRE